MPSVATSYIPPTSPKHNVKQGHGSKNQLSLHNDGWASWSICCIELERAYWTAVLMDGCRSRRAGQMTRKLARVRRTAAGQCPLYNSASWNVGCANRRDLTVAWLSSPCVFSLKMMTPHLSHRFVSGSWTRTSLLTEIGFINMGPGIIPILPLHFLLSYGCLAEVHGFFSSAGEDCVMGRHEGAERVAKYNFSGRHTRWFRAVPPL